MNPSAKSMGKVAVLMGGDSAERQVSLMSGTGVLNALLSLGVEASAFDPAHTDLSELKAERFERAFIADSAIAKMATVPEPSSSAPLLIRSPSPLVRAPTWS